jgi:Flp pilus assembly protein TadG
MSLLRSFCQNRTGSVPMIFSIAMMPITACTALAIDYARAHQARAILQSAADSTVLMLAREAAKKSQSQLQTMADPYFKAVRKNDPDIVASAPAITKDKKIVTLQVSGTVKTYFAGIFGYPYLDVGVKAASAYGTRKIEVALVLDNTGSMAAANKINELKKASKNLISTLEATSIEPGQIRISIVPYTTRVKLATSYRFDSWLTNTPTGSFSSAYSIPASRTGWTGCVGDRDKPHNTKDTPASAPMPQTLYPMVNCDGPLAEAMPLTDNWSALRTRVDSMVASGMTNIALGAAWGLEMLTGAAPFSETGTASDIERFMIVLTDGENTQNRFGWNVSDMDKDTKAVCDTITERGVPEASKKHRIRLYTVLVINGNEPLLKSCATKPEMFYKVNNASQLDSVFKQIADEIGQIRLTM